MCRNSQRSTLQYAEIIQSFGPITAATGPGIVYTAERDAASSVLSTKNLECAWSGSAKTVAEPLMCDEFTRKATLCGSSFQTAPEGRRQPLRTTFPVMFLSVDNVFFFALNSSQWFWVMMSTVAYRDFRRPFFFSFFSESDTWLGKRWCWRARVSLCALSCHQRFPAVFGSLLFSSSHDVSGFSFSQSSQTVSLHSAVTQLVSSDWQRLATDIQPLPATSSYILQPDVSFIPTRSPEGKSGQMFCRCQTWVLLLRR